MSFFNFGSSPAKPGAGSSAQSGGGSGDFNMFGNGEDSSSGAFFGGAENVTGGSFFGPAHAVGVGGNAFFGSAGFGTPNKNSMEQKTSTSFGPPTDLSTAATPAKKMKSETHKQATLSAPSPAVSVHQQTPQTTLWSNHGPTIGSKQQQLAPTTPAGTRSSTKDDHQANLKVQDYKLEPAGFSTQLPINHDLNMQAPQQSRVGSAEGHPVQKIPPQVRQQEKMSHAQSSVLTEEKTKVVAPTDVVTKDDSCENIPPSDALLRELLNMQKEQLAELLPVLREHDEKSGQIMDSAGLVMKEITSYSEKLSGIKHQYCSRLNQVSSFLRMIPKTEK